MDITIREYNLEKDYGFLKASIEALQDYIVELDPAKRTRRLPEYGEVFVKKLLENIKELEKC